MRKKKILPQFRWAPSSKPSLPLQERIGILMNRIWNKLPLWPYNDEVTVNECIKRGLIKRGRAGGSRGNNSRKWNVLLPLMPAPIQDTKRIPQPYIKRKADMKSAGLRFKGKLLNE